MFAFNDRLAHRPTPAGTGRGNEPYSVKFGRTRYATVSPENKIEEINYTVSDLYKYELICNEIRNCLEEIENFEQSQCILNIDTTLKENKP